MPSRSRRLVDGGCYHVIARGNNRQRIFHDEAAFRQFLERLGRLKRRWPAKLYHYCLMSNHSHLLLRIETGSHLPKFMQGLLRGYSRWFQQQTSYVGHVWQGRYKSPLIADESYFLEVGRYIERNPLRAGVVDRLEHYPWSSYPYYAHGAHDEWVDEDPYYERVGSDVRRRRQAYQDFVRIPGPYEALLDRALLDGRSTAGSGRWRRMKQGSDRDSRSSANRILR
jgi:putative transposase